MRDSSRVLFLILGLLCFAGCSRSTEQGEKPFAHLTEEQKIAIAKENAEACNCSSTMLPELSP